MTTTSLFLERGHAEMGLIPLADAFDTATGTTDVFNMAGHNRFYTVYLFGAGGTGTQLFTVEACDNTTPSNTTAVAFHYRVSPAAGTIGPIVACAAAGYTIVAGANQILEIEVDAATVGATGYSYVRVKASEVVNSPVTGAAVSLLLEPRDSGKLMYTAVT